MIDFIYIFIINIEIKNTSSSDQTWSREMGALATSDNPHQQIDVYPFDENYLKNVGESYDFSNRDLLISPGQEKQTWVVIDVNQSIVGPIFVYPYSKELVGYWDVAN